MSKKRSSELNDVLLEQVEDRRLLSYVPDPEFIRSNSDRRDNTVQTKFNGNSAGTRYKSKFPVKIKKESRHGTITYNAECVNISTSGILLRLYNPHADEYWAGMMEGVFSEAKNLSMSFKIPPGALPEGFEIKVKINAKLTRVVDNSEENYLLCAFQFLENLISYARRKKDRYALVASSLMLFVIIAVILLMRAGSIIYFQFNKVLYLYSIIAAGFLLSRYLCGALYRPKPVDNDFTPGVSIIIPCFNEETWIQQTIVSCVNQDYPVDKLEVIVMDDCSTDASVEKIKDIVVKLHNENPRFKTKERISYVAAEKNKGKREVLAAGAKIAKHELLVFVDSDSFLDPFAVKNLVQPFKDPKMGGVSGRCDVANTYTNSLSKMQSVRYYIAFRIMKAAESIFDAVTCLSGPLACYKKQIVLDNSDAWLNQSFLGQRATFGDDRAMTNFVLRHHRTCYQDTAICSTIVPNTYKQFLKQQMRWKRSWLRESLMAGTYIWRKEPFASLFFYMGLAVPILGPVVVLYNLVYVPITMHIFPTTFLLGLFLMSALMSTVQLLIKKSSTWLYGFFFCIFYECVLLWQMPLAILTFWKSTWGTRMTPEDIAAEEIKKRKRSGKKSGKINEKREPALDT